MEVICLLAALMFICKVSIHCIDDPNVRFVYDGDGREDACSLRHCGGSSDNSFNNLLDN